ncbi:hypothetical protein [Sulfurisphaera tokodaii]|uniref:hypothetical protein n=1 Tax=Sulfurisphaera tokodaii TaxID=111955 RepID=UPI00069C3B76
MSTTSLAVGLLLGSAESIKERRGSIFGSTLIPFLRIYSWGIVWGIYSIAFQESYYYYRAFLN